MPAGSLRQGLGVAALCVAMAAHADYKDNYALGLKAFNDGDFGKARELMQKALAEQPQPAARVRLYGQRFEAYLPQYYLGQAAFKLGDCATAVAQWNVAASRQVVAQFPELNSAQQSGFNACESRLAAKTDDKPKPPPAAAPEPAPAKVKVAENPPAPKPEAIAQAPPPVAPSPADVASSPTPAPAKRVDVAVAKPAPPPVVAPPVAKPAPAANVPPTPLQEAFDNYLAGRYAKVVRLNPEAIADTRARFHAYLVRSAARFTLAQIGNDDGELDGARADARAARALDNRTPPDGALFSPRFKTFFQESR